MVAAHDAAAPCRGSEPRPILLDQAHAGAAICEFMEHGGTHDAAADDDGVQRFRPTDKQSFPLSPPRDRLLTYRQTNQLACCFPDPHSILMKPERVGELTNWRQDGKPK
ncbi:hypothetical protein ACFWP2_24085 [Kitasatospora sp. NPDC058444]|uniref:hypothetical protein n=1 Tax=Kitasatospora sp. NPDC058444 TaxID=3346504 RepID=UPI00364B23E1